ncbi:hypothetical protein [Paenibacillus cymbidii]|uniref:hypothetical protein n=1 Tax=Paenibacillus cymbidii TaxID=1639034 RepID=UPI0010819736|nr:hypothetical protein [Paenibacillus cymbidii]
MIQPNEAAAVGAARNDESDYMKSGDGVAMLRQIWNKRQSIRFAWLISYCIILLLPICISYVVYRQFSATLE